MASRTRAVTAFRARSAPSPSSLDRPARPEADRKVSSSCSRSCCTRLDHWTSPAASARFSSSSSSWRRRRYDSTGRGVQKGVGPHLRLERQPRDRRGRRPRSRCGASAATVPGRAFLWSPAHRAVTPANLTVQPSTLPAEAVRGRVKRRQPVSKAGDRPADRDGEHQADRVSPPAPASSTCSRAPSRSPNASASSEDSSSKRHTFRTQIVRTAARRPP